MEIFLPEQKNFFWLILQGRLNTRALLKRKNMQLPDYTCVLCACNVEEDLIHLLPVPFCFGLLGHCSLDSAQYLWLRQHHREFWSSIAASFLHGDYYNNVLVNMDNEKWCHLQQRPSLSAKVQIGVQKRICSGYTKSKIKIPSTYRFMSRSICVIFLIFFLTFFVS